MQESKPFTATGIENPGNLSDTSCDAESCRAIGTGADELATRTDSSATLHWVHQAAEDEAHCRLW